SLVPIKHGLNYSKSYNQCTAFPFLTMFLIYYTLCCVKCYKLFLKPLINYGSDKAGTWTRSTAGKKKNETLQM
uniref:Uncharacterized protein n=1 Tax=Monopterus albus TaxID=43700 RepID=A0A3Q3QBF6_MONAL